MKRTTLAAAAIIGLAATLTPTATATAAEPIVITSYGGFCDQPTQQSVIILNGRKTAGKLGIYQRPAHVQGARLTAVAPAWAPTGPWQRTFPVVYTTSPEPVDGWTFTAELTRSNGTKARTFITIPSYCA